MTVKHLSDSRPDGVMISQSTDDLTGVHGVTAISQRAAAILTNTSSLFALTGASYVAQTSATVSGIVGFNTVMIVQVWDAINELRDCLVAYGWHKGGA